MGSDVGQKATGSVGRVGQGELSGAEVAAPVIAKVNLVSRAWERASAEGAAAAPCSDSQSLPVPWHWALGTLCHHQHSTLGIARCHWPPVQCLRHYMALLAPGTAHMAPLIISLCSHPSLPRSTVLPV